MDERGVNNPPEKEKREREKKKKKLNEIRRHHGAEPGVTALFQRHHFGDTNKTNYPTKNGLDMASLIFTVGLEALY